MILDNACYLTAQGTWTQGGRFRWGASSDVVDLEGRIVLPGLADAHLHGTMLGRRLTEPPLDQAGSAEDMLALVQDWYRSGDERPGIFVGGFNEEDWADPTLPTAADLDRIEADKPVVLGRICAHRGIVNHKALELMRDELTQARYRAHVELDAAGQPTGHLAEDAYYLAIELQGQAGQAAYQSALETGLLHLQSLGFAAVGSQDVSRPSEKVFWDVLEALYRGHEDLPYFVAQIGVGDLSDLAYWPELTARFSDLEKVHIGPLKLFKDGSLGARTAWLSQPYADAPDTQGLNLLPYDTQVAWFQEAGARGIQVLTHAIGDQAILETCAAFAEAQARLGRKGNPLRHAIVHAQITGEEALAAIQASGLTVITQPMFIPSDRALAPLRVGETLYQSSYAFARLDALGVPQAFSSDAPIEGANPFVSMAQVPEMPLQKRIQAYSQAFLWQFHLEGLDLGYTILDLKDPADLEKPGRLEQVRLWDLPRTID